jgi:hypothetical protein
MRLSGVNGSTGRRRLSRPLAGTGTSLSGADRQCLIEKRDYDSMVHGVGHFAGNHPRKFLAAGLGSALLSGLASPDAGRQRPNAR